jgi:hypothetical protein
MLKALSMSSVVLRCFSDATTLAWIMAGKKKNPLLVRLGREGGKKGAKARMEKLTPAQRSEIARVAARARWSRQKGNPSHA